MAIKRREEGQIGVVDSEMVQELTQMLLDHRLETNRDIQEAIDKIDHAAQKTIAALQQQLKTLIGQNERLQLELQASFLEEQRLDHAELIAVQAYKRCYPLRSTHQLLQYQAEKLKLVTERNEYQNLYDRALTTIKQQSGWVTQHLETFEKTARVGPNNDKVAPGSVSSKWFAAHPGFCDVHKQFTFK